MDPPPRFPSTLPHFDIQTFLNDPVQREWSGPFTFVHMADPQFGLIEKYYMKKEIPRWDEEIRITKAAIQQINELSPKPKFVMVGGDMLDTRPGTAEEMRIRKEQYDDFMETFKLLDAEINIVVCAGNHDVDDVPTPATISVYHEQFGPDFFSFWVGGIKFTVLNSQYWKSPETVPEHYQNQQNFLGTIPDPNAKHSVVFQHIPFFISDPDEEDVKFLNIEKVHRFPVMDQLESGGVKHMFCGHYHRNAGGSYKGLNQVVTSALCNPLGDDPCGFRIVSVDKEKIESEFVGIANLD